MQITDVADIKTIITQGKYKACGLFDSAGSVIVPYNSAKIPVLTRLAEILDRVESPGMQGGVYVIRCKASPTGRGKADEFYIQKAGKMSEQRTPIVFNQLAQEPENIGYSEAIRLTREAAQLKTENEFLKEKIKVYEDEDNEDEDEPEIEKPSEPLAEGATWVKPLSDTLSNLLSSVVPVLDRYFDIREKEVMLKMGAPLAEGAPPPAAHAKPKNNNEIASFTQYYNSLGEPDRLLMVAQLKELKPTSIEWASFFSVYHKLKNVNLPLYNDLTEKLQLYELI